MKPTPYCLGYSTRFCHALKPSKLTLPQSLDMLEPGKMKQKTAVVTTVKQMKQKVLAELAVFPQPEYQYKLEYLYVNYQPGQLYKDHVVIIT